MGPLLQPTRRFVGLCALCVVTLTAFSCERVEHGRPCSDPTWDMVIHYSDDDTAIYCTDAELDGDPTYPTVVTFDERTTITYPTVDER